MVSHCGPFSSYGCHLETPCRCWLGCHLLSLRSVSIHTTSAPYVALLPNKSPWWKGPLPVDVQRASVRTLQGYDSVLLTGTSCSAPHRPSPRHSVLQAWQEAAELCSDYYGWLPDEIEIQGDKSSLAAALVAGCLRVISDGSFKNTLGTATILLLT
ncbi:unnamed protein product [Cylindrotheca closterium]|uniref:Uncharacterized protein n=1 Tax=Cylindrotheca closterium TaxID=2856 RepID=A0AAD2FY02_9STRA|nr:unnamed protein product [Cylindrotheca closterium]